MKILVLESMLYPVLLLPLGIFLSIYDTEEVINNWWFLLFAFPALIFCYKFLLEMWLILLYFYLKYYSQQEDITKTVIRKSRLSASYIALPLISIGVIAEKNGIINILYNFIYFSFLYNIPVITIYYYLKIMHNKSFKPTPDSGAV